MGGSTSLIAHGLIAACTLVLLAGPAAAGDGVIEINQVRALAGGVTPGDAPGFPVLISRSGSYRLTGDLDVRAEPLAADVTAVEIEASNVTIDLNGFAIVGPAVCSGIPVVCAFAFSTRGVPLPGSGVGIDASSRANVVIRNGIVRGMGADGLDLGEGAIVVNVNATGNFLAGMRLRSHSLVTGCSASLNGDVGIVVETSAAGAVLIGNTLRANGSGGIVADTGAVLWKNTALQNGASGLLAREGSIALENSSRSSFSRGLRLFGAAGYGRNVLTANGVSGVEGGVQIGGNVCGAAPCP